MGRKNLYKVLVLEYIRQFHSDYGYGPSFREIAAAVGSTSVSVIQVNCQRLRAEGLIRFEDRKQRTIRPVEGK